MTKRFTPALMPLSEDPTQPQFMHELLQAGRDASASDYNFEQGLSKHLALIDAGAPTPHWAEGLRKGAGAAPTAAGSSLVPWLAVPIVAAALVSAAVFISRHTARQVEPASAPHHEIRLGGSGVEQVVRPAAAPATPAQPGAAVIKSVPRAQTVVSSPVAPSLVTNPARKTLSARPASRVTRATHDDKRANALGAASSVGADNAAATSSHAGLNSKLAAAPASASLFAQAQPAVASHPSAAEAGADEPPAAHKPEAQVVRNVPQQPAPQDDSKLEREMAMLAMAQRVLLTDPARALGLARQGEAEFAGSMFTQERQQLLLLSLVRLDRLDEAKRLAKPYLTRYPAGPFSDRVRRALATGKVER